MPKKKYNNEDRCPNHPDRQQKVKGLCKTCYRQSLVPEDRKYYKQWNLRRYGLTLDAFNELLIKQNYKCAICNTKLLSLSEKKGRHNQNPQVDHNHLTNEVRGLLCRLCNVGLGAFKENKETLQKAITYLAGEDRFYGKSNSTA